MSWKGDLLKAGILSDGNNLNLIRGRVQYDDADISRDVETCAIVALDDGNATATVDQLLNSRVFKMTPTANRTFTTPTAAAIITGLGDYAVGSNFLVTIVNLASATYTITMTAGTGVTVVGKAVVDAATSGTFRVIVTSSTAVSVVRI